MEKEAKRSVWRALTVVVIALVSAVIVWWPILFGHKALLHDWAGVNYWTFHAAGDFLRTFHQFPVWTEGYFSGYPFVRSLVGLYHPAPIALLTFLDGISAYHFLLLFNFVLTFCVAFMLGKALRVSDAASYILAFAYTYTQWTVQWAHNDSYSNIYFLPPLLFWMCIRLREKPFSFRYLVPGVLGLAVGFTSGVPDTVIVTVLAAGAFALFLDWHQASAAGEYCRFSAWKTTIAYSCVAAASAVIALFFLLPTAVMLPMTFRQGGITFAEAAGSGFTPADMALLLFPNFPALPYLPNQPWIYTGIGTLFLGIMGIAARRTHFLGTFFSWMLGTFFAIGFRYSPVYGALHQLPVLQTQRSQFKLLLLGFFALAVLASIGADALLRADIQPTVAKIRRWFFWCSAFALALTGSVLLALHTRLGDVIRDIFLEKLRVARGNVKSPAYYADVFSKFSRLLAERLSFTNYHFTVALSMLAAFTALLWLWQRGKLALHTARRVLAVLVAATAILIWRNYHVTVDRRSYLERPATLAYLDSIKPAEPFRIFSPMPDTLDATAFTPDIYRRLYNTLALPNANIQFEYETISGFENFATRRHAMLIAAFNSYDVSFPNGALFGKRPTSLSPALLTTYQGALSMMNVRYLITPYALGHPWKNRYTTSVSGTPFTVFIYENPDVLPRAYFPSAVRVLPIDEVQNLPLLLRNADFKALSFVECGDCTGQESASADARVEIVAYQPGYLRMRTHTGEARWLVVSESNLPSWHITLDGKPVHSYLANYIYHGIEVPAGEHDITMRFPGLWDQFRDALGMVRNGSRAHQGESQWTRNENF